MYSFAILEHHVIWIIEQLEPGYWQDYALKEKTAGAVAKDLDEVAKGHATEAELLSIFATSCFARPP